MSSLQGGPVNGADIVHVANYRGTTTKMELHEKVRLDIGVSEPFVNVTVNVVMKAARTGEEYVDAVTPPMIEGSVSARQECALYKDAFRGSLAR